jgi:histone deacetylase 1/2
MYLLNRRLCSTVRNAIPYALLYNKTPDYSHLRVFGCLCYPNFTATARHKLAPRSTACVFLGYPSSHKGYCCLNLSTRRIIISRHVVFDKTCFPFGLYTFGSSPSDLDFLLAGTVLTHLPVAAPLHADIERPRPTQVVLEELPDDPVILLRGPVVAAAPAPPAAAPPPPAVAPAPPAQDFHLTYSRRP